MDATTITYRRGELYEQVWAEPMTTVAARFGVSSVALGKMCRKLGVPAPPRGYWAKRKFGHAPRPPPLPPLRTGQKEEITARRRNDPQPEPAGSGVAPEGPNPEVVVLPTLERPHDLVAATARELRRSKAIHDGMVSAVRSNGRLDVHVAPASLDRAMRIADALLKACKHHGVAIKFASLEPKGGWRYRSINRELEHQTCLLIDEETFLLSIREHWSIYKPPVPAHLKRPSRARELRLWELWEGCRKRVPNGILELRLDGEYTGRTAWKDGKRPLEACLGEVIGRMPSLAAQNKQGRAEQKRRERAEHEAELRRWRAEERAQKERQREAELRQRVDRWKLARDIREHVAAARTAGRFEVSYLEWALAYADRIDPIA